MFSYRKLYHINSYIFVVLHLWMSCYCGNILHNVFEYKPFVIVGVSVIVELILGVCSLENSAALWYKIKHRESNETSGSSRTAGKPRAVFAVDLLVPGHEIFHPAGPFVTEVYLPARQFYKSSATGVLWYPASIPFSCILTCNFYLETLAAAPPPRQMKETSFAMTWWVCIIHSFRPDYHSAMNVTQSPNSSHYHLIMTNIVALSLPTPMWLTSDSCSFNRLCPYGRLNRMSVPCEMPLHTLFGLP